MSERMRGESATRQYYSIAYALSHNSQGTRNPYDYEPTPASAELFWLTVTVTVGTGVHGKLKKHTATGRLPSVVFGTRFARRRREFLKILCTFLKRTYIILDVQIALKMTKNDARG